MKCELFHVKQQKHNVMSHSSSTSITLNICHLPFLRSYKYFCFSFCKTCSTLLLVLVILVCYTTTKFILPNLTLHLFSSIFSPLCSSYYPQTLKITNSLLYYVNGTRTQKSVSLYQSAFLLLEQTIQHPQFKAERLNLAHNY